MVNKITEEDLINKGVIGLPDVPGLTTIEMQKKFDEISRDVIIPRFNELIDKTVSPSDEFSKFSTYNVGDYCIYQSVLYKCTTEINTAGEWDATKWKATSIDKELVALNSNLNKMFITKNFYPIVGVINGNAVKSITFDVGVEGYTPISFKIISYASAMSDCSICFYNITDNNATLFFRNNSSNPTPDGATAYCTVNYIKK